MDSNVSRVLALIPERSPRFSSGTRFLPTVAACPHPERLVAVSQFLNWLTPLGTLSRDDQQRLGTGSAGARPSDTPDESDDTEAEVGEPTF
jgi:hypothetical protein